MLTPKKPDVAQFIEGAKAEKGATVPRVKQAKRPTQKQARPGEPQSLYQLRLPKDLHRQLKQEAAGIDMPLGDYIIDLLEKRKVKQPQNVV